MVEAVEGLVTEATGIPAYQLVMNDLKGQIGDGRLRVGDQVPSAARLRERYKVSSTVVQRAINELKNQGIVVGRPGKGVFVTAVPERESGVLSELAGLARRVVAVEAAVKELYRRLDQPYDGCIP